MTSVMGRIRFFPRTPGHVLCPKKRKETQFLASTLPLSIPLSICAPIYSRILHSPTHERKNKIPMSVSSAQGISCILLFCQVGNCDSAFSAHFYSRFAASLPTPPLLLTRLIEQLTHAGSAVSRGGPSDRPPPPPNSFHRFPT